MKFVRFITIISICIILAVFNVNQLYGREDKVKPDEPGVYIKTGKSVIRLMPNIVFDEQGLLYIESNNPKHFFLKDIEYFIVSGRYNMDVLTLNPLLFFQASPLGKPRYVFGKDIEVNVKNNGADSYIIRPKGLMGRGYYCIWIDDSVWDFVVE